MDVMTPSRYCLPSLIPNPVHNLPRPLSNWKSSTIPRPHDETVSLEQTKQIHAHLIKGHPVDHNQSSTFAFLSQLPSSLAAQYNSVISSYTKHNCPLESLKVYAHLRWTSFFVDNFIIPSVLKGCGKLLMISIGKEIHGYVLKLGFDGDVFVYNALMQMYSESGTIECAWRVFSEMPERDVVSWSTMIGCYGKNGYVDKAFELIREMQVLELRPSSVALVNMINLCADVGVLETARAMHCYVVKNINSETASVIVNTALIEMYVKSHSIFPARRIFNLMTDKSVVTWTVMIAGYIRARNPGEAYLLFCDMADADCVPNEITMLSLVVECGFSGSLHLGKWLHAYVLKNGYEISAVLSTALIDMYGKCGEVRVARAIFDSMVEKDTMSWTAMISGYAQVKNLGEAFSLFVQMKKSRFVPNQITMVFLLSLCAEAGALDLGKWLHSLMDKMGIKVDLVLATALVDMYAKCGDVEAAHFIFSRTENRDLCIWNAMLGGFAMHGLGKEALTLFSEMQRLLIKPNGITFVGILYACSHAGMVEEGHQFFNQMVNEYKMIPQVEHYGCMVDLLGRTGLLDEAYEIIQRMPMKPNIVVWGSLLASCKLHKKLALAEVVAEKLLELDPENCGYRVLMSNIYAAGSRWKDVADVRRSLKDSGIRKPPGFSSIEVNGLIHEFVMGDGSHPKRKEIHKMLEEMNYKLKVKGYVANTSSVLFNIDEEDKETALNFHSEKLAIAFGLISTAPSTPLRIVKNLRVCDDCHNATKLLSKIYNRLIIVRDRSRFHRFSEGSCSCKDYW